MFDDFLVNTNALLRYYIRWKAIIFLLLFCCFCFSLALGKEHKRSKRKSATDKNELNIRYEIESTDKDNHYSFYRIPGIICTEKRTLICYYECRHGGDWGATDLAFRRSTNNGKTWGKRVIIESGKGINVIHNPMMFADGRKIVFLWVKNYRELFCSYSLDEGMTWTTPKNISFVLEELRTKINWTVAAIGPGHGIRLRNGRLICGVWVGANPKNIHSHSAIQVTTLYSDDHGETWHCGELIKGNESALAELQDGSVLINIRHKNPTHRRKIAVSKNGVSGWYDIHFADDLPDPVCAAGMTQNGNILYFSNCNSTTHRINLCIKKSVDGGKTWQPLTKVCNKAGYSDIFYSPINNSLNLIMEETPKKLVYHRITL